MTPIELALVSPFKSNLTSENMNRFLYYIRKSSKLKRLRTELTKMKILMFILKLFGHLPKTRYSLSLSEVFLNWS